MTEAYIPYDTSALFYSVNTLNPAKENQKHCRVDQDKVAHNEPSHQYLHNMPFSSDFSLTQFHSIHVGHSG